MKRRRPSARAVRLLVAGCALVALAVAGATLLITRETSKPVPHSSVVARFRAQIRAGVPPPRSRSVPAAGVYRYGTRGYEQATALGTRRHAYPAETTVTVVPTACGWRERWDALTTRYEERTFCLAPAGRRLVAYTDAHEFFGRSDRRTYRCAPGSLTAPPLASRRAAWASNCAIPGTRVEERGRVIGAEAVTVGDARVPTVHTSSRSRTTGDTVGTGVVDLWLARPSGLLVRARVANESTTETFAGDVPYVERYELRLRSLQPLR